MVDNCTSRKNFLQQLAYELHSNYVIAKKCYSQNDRSECVPENPAKYRKWENEKCKRMLQTKCAIPAWKWCVEIPQHNCLLLCQL